MQRPGWITYPAFIALSMGVGLLIGVITIPGPWYQALAKPPFTPPNWLFAPAWTILYALIGIVGARVFGAKDSRGLFRIWLIQMLLNFAWSPVFFGWQLAGAALVVIILLLITIAAFMVRARRRDPVSVALFAPYFIWVAYASYLNAGIYLLN
ncbi:TspO/MBR family protein [uncultured Cohaesibacter sp.]|uniref:TspO/MBR family protein n=1 Tax=uncultured Cohaesibacter sp. TaxID=1002546 RepID=UPI0029C65349|nr:TspO/MBR family protein [uncultured Cohaesibacter sp.]